MTIASTWRRLTVLLSVGALSGCYKYIPTEAELEPPGQEIRVEVTRLGAEQMTEISDESMASGTITGEVVGVEDDDLLMKVAVGERQRGFQTVDLNQTIRVPLGEVLRLERRELDGTATGLVIGGVAAAGVAVVFTIMKAFGTSAPNDETPPPVEFLRFNLLSLPWSFR